MRMRRMRMRRMWRRGRRRQKQRREQRMRSPPAAGQNCDRQEKSNQAATARAAPQWCVPLSTEIDHALMKEQRRQGLARRHRRRRQLWWWRRRGIDVVVRIFLWCVLLFIMINDTWRFSVVVPHVAGTVGDLGKSTRAVRASKYGEWHWVVDRLMGANERGRGLVWNE